MQEEDTALRVVLIVNVRLTPYLFGRAMETIVVGRKVLMHSRWIKDMLLKPKIQKDTLTILNKRVAKIRQNYCTFWNLVALEKRS